MVDKQRSSLVGLQVGGQLNRAVVLEAAAEGISGASAETCGVTHCERVVAGDSVSCGGAKECRSRAHVRREVGRSICCSSPSSRSKRGVAKSQLGVVGQLFPRPHKRIPAHENQQRPSPASRQRRRPPPLSLRLRDATMAPRSYSKTYKVPRRPFESARLYVAPHGH